MTPVATWAHVRTFSSAWMKRIALAGASAFTRALVECSGRPSVAGNTAGNVYHCFGGVQKAAYSRPTPTFINNL